MKKILAILALLFIVTGCALTDKLDNTPTKQVEAYLNKYQMTHDDVLEDLNTVVNNELNFTDQQKNTYRDIIKENYQKMTYNVKDERIDGDKAYVTVELNVVDYHKGFSDADQYLKDNPEEFNTEDKYDEGLFTEYRLKKMQEQTEKVLYTVEFSLTKNNDGDWTLDNPSSDIRDKINGMYPR